MDEREFQRLLLLFPVVRNRNHHQAESESSGQSTSQAPTPPMDEVNEWQDAWSDQETTSRGVFWDKLKSAAERMVGPEEAEDFCDAFQRIYRKLVHEELSKEVMQNFLNSSGRA
ncbi:hypothetical protein BVRB_4g073990 isoform A [Beta vulgaris subsp. vulgaris]|uniref:uncharacterized protein LOC104890114 isoform X2 n=1 Tax=Beta vulgaris subsp. vulgaris TaxID=3555 RepID=UPI00053F7B8A|nr:uncharacterized protein LOC104890114 isoform X2 [Beta vulgaris subsp. vulgaris]KMT14630.1 hypothetical protein BVRB_4g073990 isoform A [Beta vulgaris subsp. vulgaris]